MPQRAAEYQADCMVKNQRQSWCPFSIFGVSRYVTIDQFWLLLQEPQRVWKRLGAIRVTRLPSYLTCLSSGIFRDRLVPSVTYLRAWTSWLILPRWHPPVSCHLCACFLWSHTLLYRFMDLLTGSAHHESTTYFYLTKIHYVLLLHLRRLSSLAHTYDISDHYS